MTNEVKHKAEGTTLTLERTFDAPVELVFGAFSDDTILCQWWAPQGFTIPKSTMDFREGGSWHYMMLGGPDMGEWSNMESWGISFYDKIEPTTKIVYRDAFTDETGVPNPDRPQASAEMTFTEQDGKTLLTSLVSYEKEEELQTVIGMGMIDGITSAYENLDAVLAKQQAM